MRFLVAIFLLLTTACTTAQSNKAVLQYVVREPKIKSAHPPVIFLLHGFGANENDLFSFADQLPDKYLIISARAPYGHAAKGYAWYQYGMEGGKPIINAEQAEKSRMTILQFIDQMQELYHFDKQEIILCGFSQGAIMSYIVALTNPGKVKGIAVLSGRILDEVKPKIGPYKKSPSLRVFISHGARDPILNVRYAREAVVYLKTLGITPEYKEYDDVHTIDPEMQRDMIKWLERM